RKKRARMDQIARQKPTSKLCPLSLEFRRFPSQNPLHLTSFISYFWSLCYIYAHYERSELPEHSSLKSRYGIDKLHERNYQSWAWMYQLLMEERDVWTVVHSYPGSILQPISASGT